MNPPQVIAEREALARLGAELVTATRLAVDTETNGLHAYSSRVCLIQIADASRVWIVDPLALAGAERGDAATVLAPLLDLLEDRRLPKILHGSSHDVASLKQDFGRGIRGLFDTYIATQYLNYDRIGLADLVARHFGVTLSKRLQKADWSRRPLTPEALDYLAHDVAHLLPLYDLIRRELEQADLVEEVELESARQEETAATPPPFDPDGFWRWKEVDRLGDRELAGLRELHAARDRIARRLDRPAFKVISDQLLMELAGLKSERQVDGHGFLNKPHLRSYRREFVQAFARSRHLPRPDRPRRRAASPFTPGAPDKPVREQLAAALKEWRRAEATRRGIATAAVLPNYLLDALVLAPPRRESDLDLPWFGAHRRRLYGRILVELMAKTLGEPAGSAEKTLEK